MKRLVLIAFLVVAASAASAQSIPAPSAWTNQRGSTLYIQSIDGGSGQLTGVYINRASGFYCLNYPYPVTGWVYGNAITFTVSWWSSHAESCNSLTSWTGSLTKDTISTTWQMVVTPSGQRQNGTDTFTRVTATTQPSLINPGQ